MLKKINEEAMLNSAGKFRTPLEDTVILPKPKQDSLPTWRAVGGGPSSARKAGRQGDPVYMA